VSLRNPRSRYSFINYLFENNRLLEHFNLPGEFPLRKEYAQYIRWVSEKFAHLVRYGSRVSDVAIVDQDGDRVYEITAQDGSVHRGRSLVVGTGRTPLVPPPFDMVRSDRVFHLTQYLYKLAELKTEPTEIAVIGGSQSAVEITLDLAKRYPRARITVYVRSYSLRLKDTSPFSEEGYFPGFTDYYYNANRGSKNTLDAFMRATNYSSADDDVLHELYLLIYEQRLDGEQRVFVRGNRQVHAVTATDDKVQLDVTEVHTGELETDEVDFVVLATGFRDLGPGPHQERYPAPLTNVAEDFRFDEEGFLVVNPDYSIEPADPGTPDLFLNGLCESSHGIGDAGSFSLLSLRAATIGESLRKRLAGDRARQRQLATN
jgi:L-ornithine N5-oxygenase